MRPEYLRRVSPDVRGGLEPFLCRGEVDFVYALARILYCRDSLGIQLRSSLVAAEQSVASIAVT